MSSNIEVKARSHNFQRQSELVAELAGSASEVLVQCDTFFHATSGRLKLREFANGSGELIPYERSDAAEVRRSDYMVVPVPDPPLMIAALERSIGVRGVVRKRRRLWIVDQTRIHFDEVESLGNFIELEVVMREGQGDAEGQAIAKQLMEQLEIRTSDLIDRAYIDLIEQSS